MTATAPTLRARSRTPPTTTAMQRRRWIWTWRSLLTWTAAPNPFVVGYDVQYRQLDGFSTFIAGTALQSARHLLNN